MPAGRYRSRTFRRIFRRTPSGKAKLHYTRRKPSYAQCGKCGAVLKGVPRAMHCKVRNMAKSKKRPERPYGGNLCSGCMRKNIIEMARREA